MLVQPAKPLDRSQVPLDQQTQDTLRAWRPLSAYKLNYINHQYPLLSLLYAVMAGGENALYCDYTGEFVSQYMFADPAHPTDEEKAKANAVGTALNQVMGEREVMRTKPPEQQQVIVPSPADWDAILGKLKEELMQFVQDPQEGVVAPPLCMW